jgi:uncharacterized protein (TIGR02271 family)
MKTVIGILDNHQEAMELQNDLIKSGFKGDTINIVTNEPKEKKSFSQTLKEIFGAQEVPKEHQELYAEGVRRGGILVSVNTEDKDADKAAQIMSRHSAVDIEKRAEHWQKTGWSGFDEKAKPYSAEEAARERKIIPVLEEEVKIGKRTVPTGRVRVYSRVIESPVEEKVSLRVEHARVERRPVDRPATAADERAFRETSIEISETAEEPVISKEARVKEEVVVGKEAIERTQTVRESARHIEVKIDDENFRKFYNSLSISDKEKDDKFDEYWAAYSYSREKSFESRYEGKHWNDVEKDLHEDWERKHPGTWTRFKDSIHQGWEAL